MDYKPEEQEIIDLLAKLKNANGGYPKKLLASRRQIYLNQVANVGMGLGIGGGINNVAKSLKGGVSQALSGSSILEAILVAVIVIQAGFVAYTYKDKIVDYFGILSPTAILEVSPQSASQQPELTTTGSVAPEKTATVTVTASVTPPAGQPTDGDATGDQPNVTATPDPNLNNDNGNHYGQTPRPPRPTKEQTVPEEPKATKEKKN